MDYIICPAPVKEFLDVTVSLCYPASQNQGNRDRGQKKERVGELPCGEMGRRGPSEFRDACTEAVSGKAAFLGP